MLTMKLKDKTGKWQAVEMPPDDQITVEVLKTWIGKPCVLCYEGRGRTRYAFGYDAVRGSWEEGKTVLSMDLFCDFWLHELCEMGMDVYARIELSEERTAIMEVEGESQETIAAVLAASPELYQTDLDFEVPDDF